MEEKDEIEFYDNIDVAMDNSYKVLTGVDTFEAFWLAMVEFGYYLIRTIQIRIKVMC